jgi:transcriptional regulatory protein RtcR
MKPKVVIGFLGTTLDGGPFGPGRWNKWRPTVGLCMHEDLRVDRLVLLHGAMHRRLAEHIVADIASVSPETAVEPQVLDFADPWDFEEVYGKLLDFARAYPFDPEAEDYLVHITTGTHVGQICLFLLTEAHYLPGQLLQTQPRRGALDAAGSWSAIDLDLSRYDSIATRFAATRAEGASFLKSGIDTRNAAFNHLIDEIEQVAARTKAPLLLMGPTGAGKSQLACRIYELKKNRRQISGPLVEVNCATLRGDSAMSALFGHRKGAFTGAIADKKGLFAAAEGGTLFLDEIGDLPLPLQSKLLRVLQDGEVRPLGATEGQRHDVRVIAATNVDLRGRVEAGRFRQDLFYRISVFPIVMPPLRARPEDIDVLVDDFITQFARQHGKPVPGIAPEALAALRRYRFPGNVRELKNVMERAVILCRQGGPIGLEDLPSDVLLDSQAPEAPPALEPTDNHPGVLRSDMKRYEARAIEQALRSSGGNRTRAARSLGLARRTLQEKISRYGLGGQ